MIIKLKNLEDTERLAKIVAENINDKLILLLNGDLAAGKTTFTKFLAKYLGVKTVVNSPTFNIMKEYNSDKGVLYHIDAYRLENSDEDLGFEDIFYEDNICVIEWATFIEDFLPNERVIFNITLDNDIRNVEISTQGKLYKDFVERIEKQWLV